MGKETSLRELIAQAAQNGKPPGIIIGKVASVDPLEIQVPTDAKLLLTDSNLRVPKHLTNYDVRIRLTGGEDVLYPAIIYNGLEKGDEVYLLQYEGGQLYFVLDKVG